jgi:hypothetical protein
MSAIGYDKIKVISLSAKNSSFRNSEILPIKVGE